MSLDVMKQALEAFDELLMSISLSFLREKVSHIDKYENGVKATRALRAAIKEAEKQEPVAWMHPSWIDPDTRGWESDSFNAIPIEGWVPVYTAPVDAVNIKSEYVDETAKRKHEPR